MLTKTGDNNIFRWYAAAHGGKQDVAAPTQANLADGTAKVDDGAPICHDPITICLFCLEVIM